MVTLVGASFENEKFKESPFNIIFWDLTWTGSRQSLVEPRGADGEGHVAFARRVFPCLRVVIRRSRPFGRPRGESFGARNEGPPPYGRTQTAHVALDGAVVGRPGNSLNSLYILSVLDEQSLYFIHYINIMLPQ